jgi:hypothetical protein
MRRIRKNPRRTVVWFAAVLAAAGCGGAERATETTPPRPTIPREVADDLAARSEAIAEALDAGDVCTAAVRADELNHATIGAINEGKVPRAFQEDLQARANELVNTINCPPPPTTTEEDDKGGEGKGGEGKAGGDKGKDKKDENKGDEQKGGEGEDGVITVPLPVP